MTLQIRILIHAGAVEINFVSYNEKKRCEKMFQENCNCAPHFTDPIVKGHKTHFIALNFDFLAKRVSQGAQFENFKLNYSIIDKYPN